MASAACRVEGAGVAAKRERASSSESETVESQLPCRSKPAMKKRRKVAQWKCRLNTYLDTLFGLRHDFLPLRFTHVPTCLLFICLCLRTCPARSPGEDPLATFTLLTVWHTFGTCTRFERLVTSHLDFVFFTSSFFSNIHYSFFFPPLIDWPIANESFLHRWLITYFHYPWNAIQHALFSAKVKVLYFTRWAKGSFTHASRKTPIFTSCEVQFRTMLVRTIWFRLFCLEYSSKNALSH